MYSRYWADLSNNNASFNAGAYARSGHVLVAHKATEGLRFTDGYHADRCVASHQAKVAVVHYHFARPDQGNPPEAEARFFVSVAGPHFKHGQDKLCLDLERERSNGSLEEWAKAFSREVKRRLEAPLLYLNLDYWQRHRGAQLSGQRIWLAEYGPRADVRGYWAWQRTDGQIGPAPHSVAGVPGTCDVNILSVRAFAGVLANRARWH